jgi:beta-aspartyl-peptidase (threonine type)
MRYVFLTLILCAGYMVKAQLKQPQTNIVLVVHGGAGTILKSRMTPEKEQAYKSARSTALEKGYAVLNNGGSSVDAVEVAIKILEDNPLFNAGKGAVFTHSGKNELDASIMNGKTLEAGAVAGVTTVKNPVSAARAVMEKSSHVMMAGAGAEAFAREQGLEMVDPSYFYTKERWEGLLRAKRNDSLNTKAGEKGHSIIVERDSKWGTVGAVALDKQGNLAAATSTGGMTNKRYGRIGDSPVIGAGTYASNATCAISCTGWGEFFIRLVMAKTVSDMMEFGKMSLKEATQEMILKRLPALGGDGGLIAVDRQGNIALPFNTSGMYRGYVKKDGIKVIHIYKNE